MHNDEKTFLYILVAKRLVIVLYRTIAQPF